MVSVLLSLAMVSGGGAHAASVSYDFAPVRASLTYDIEPHYILPDAPEEEVSVGPVKDVAKATAGAAKGVAKVALRPVRRIRENKPVRKFLGRVFRRRR